MKNIKYWSLTVAIVLIIWCVMTYYNMDELQLVCVISDVDGNRYCVRDRKEVSHAADLLAKTTAKMKKLVAYMKRKHPNDPRVKQLVSKFNPKKIIETLPTSEFTAYSENKGEKIAFCLNKKKHSDAHLIDIDTLTFVALHELTHIMTTQIGHVEVFWQNFKFVLENAKEANIHIPVDYKQVPREYCGMKITDNPYYDLH